MLVQHLLQKILTLCIAVALIIGGIFTFDDPILFDWLFFGTLFFVALLSHKNVNILGIILIIVLGKVVDEAAWLLLTDTLPSKSLVYLALMATLFIIKEEEYRKPIAILFFTSLVTEIYWVITGYDAPEIYWYIFEINMLILVRHYLFMRVFFTSQWFPGKSKSIDLDIDIHDLVTAFMFMHGLTILEYLIRHILAIDLKVTWHINPYISHILSTYVVFIILNGSAQLSLDSKFKA
jgi:hypothetical protein